MTPEREQTIAVMRELAAKVGKDTRLGRKFLELAEDLPDLPDTPPRTAPVKYVRPAGASIGLERSLPRGDRDDDAQAELTFGPGPIF